ncbi:hypothetical protein G5V57_14335 [Nordella sp. HKS 07]|uniref:hypothetical protein n=1 Tax=Nordella sp. HKS 07 TaxID=2712222 RepID=UPI0013E1CA14|nr:hypothetical protein [Nordella sp. HKS 07]QIG48802.1 hypothetical protein G5V57_14335 [Nordella sp. HKS 07]
MIEEKSFAQRWEEWQRRWDDYSPSKALWLWSCVGSAILTAAIGFTSGGWVTRGSAESMAMRAADIARAELVATACVRNFASGPDFEARLAAFKEVGEPNRESMLQEKGWVTLAGMDEPLATAASLCADELANMELGPATAPDPGPDSSS